MGDKPVRLRVDLVGDGRTGWEVSGSGVELVGMIYIRPQVVGSFELVAEAFTANGCFDRSGMKRIIQVVP